MFTTVLAAALLACQQQPPAVSGPTASRPAPPERVQWEYLIIYVGGEGFVRNVREFDKAGADGWEVVGFYHQGNTEAALLKRRKQ